MPSRSYSSSSGSDEAVSTEGMTFDLDGVTFECHGVFDVNDLTDLATALMDASESWVDPEALGAMGHVFRTIMGEEAYKAFRRHRREHRTSPEVVSKIMMDLVEDITRLPTTRRSASPGGPPGQAGPSSPAVSSSPGSRKAARGRSPLPVPGRVLPADVPDGDVTTAPAPGSPAQEEAPMRRVVNMGDASRTRVDRQAG